MVRLFGFFCCALFLLITSLSCDSSEPPPIVPPPPPPPDYRKITLAVEDVSYTEAWLNIKTDSINFPAGITLLKNTNEEKFVLINSDTTVYVDSLQPNVNYTFQAVLTGDTIKSDTVKAKTLEPTSHNFTWTTWEFGAHSSSALYDVAIIDENNIWAVGEIYMNDSLGNPDPHAYNAAHWDGSEWNLLRILVRDFGTITGYFPLKAVFAFSENSVWFASFADFIKWDGNSFSPKAFFMTIIPFYGQVNKIWGMNENNIYCVGNTGSIYKYFGTGWQTIESGTDLDLTDIYGDSEGNLYAAGLIPGGVNGVVVKGDQSGNWSVMIEGDNIDSTELFDKLYGSLVTIWVDEHNTIYTGGNLLYQYKNEQWDYVRSLPENFINGNHGNYYRGYLGSIRGNSSNDLIIAGQSNTLKHFNGADWEQLGLPYDPDSDIRWSKVEIKGNTAVSVGAKGIHSFIMILNR